MRTARPIAWVLLRNEVRLAWRSINPQSATLLLIFGGLALTLGQMVALLLVSNVRAHGLAITLEQQTWALAGSLMFGAAFLSSVQAVCERSDSDLLLPAPIRPGLIVFARWAGVTASALLPAVLIFPLINAAALLLSPRYAGGYAVLLLLGAAAGAAGIMGALGIVKLFGARRGRTIAQVLGALVSALVYLSFQLPQMLNRAPAGLNRFLARISENPLTRLLAEAGRSAWLPLVALAVLAAILAGVTFRFFGRVLVLGYQEGTTVSRSSARPPRARPMDTRWFPAAWRKDVRLILRDPLLLAQTLPSVLYIFPALIIMIREVPRAALAAGGVVVAGQFSNLLAAVLASGEQGWDLMRMSPTAHRAIMLPKLAAALAAPLGTCLLCVLALAGIGHPLAACDTLAAGLMVAVPAGWLEVCEIHLSPRADIIRRRRREGRGFVHGIIVMILLGFGAASAGFAAADRCLVALVLLAATGLVGAGIVAANPIAPFPE